MRDEILQALALAHGPQTSAELHDALRRGGAKIEQHVVVAELRKLQNDGWTRWEGTRWRLLKPVVVRPRDTAPKSASAVSPQAVPATNRVAQARQAAPVRPTPTGRWVVFRRLCRYYCDCLVQDEAPQLRAFVENENDTWIAVHQAPWARLSQGNGFAVPLALEQAPFQRNRDRRAAEDSLYLGYPMSFVRSGDKSGFLVPIFVQPMSGEWRGGVLHLDPEGPIAINGAWLEGRLRSSAERTAFLRHMGFVSEALDDEEETDAPHQTAMDFATLAQSAASYLHDDRRVAETIQPLQLGATRDWKRAEPAHRR